MNTKAKLLLLEILALDAQYSSKDIDEVEKLLLNEKGTENERRILSLVRLASAKVRSPAPRELSESHQQLKAKLSASLRSASLARLNQFADMVGIVPADTKDETIRKIRDKLKTMSVDELKRYDGKTSKDAGVDQGFVKLADFILKGPDQKEAE